MSIGAARALLALGVLLAACAAAPAGGGQPVVRATPADEGTSLEVAVAGGEVAIDIRSERGIGGATVELSGAPATSLVLRLHLRGLEELRIADGRGTTVVAVSSGPGHAISQRRVAADGGEQAIGPASPDWLAVSIVSAAPNPSFPLSDGHFAVALPPTRGAGEAGPLSIQWVDFFR